MRDGDLLLPGHVTGVSPLIGRYGMSFAELREILRSARKLRGFPLVDSPTQMVLLGSVQRTELITAIEKHIGKERSVKSNGKYYFP